MKEKAIDLDIQSPYMQINEIYVNLISSHRKFFSILYHKTTLILYHKTTLTILIKNDNEFR